MKKLKNVLNEHKEEYIKYLSELVSIDTQDLGHGIDGGREEKGQEYLIKLLEKMGADKIEKDALEEETIKNVCSFIMKGIWVIIMIIAIMYMLHLLEKVEKA